MNPLRISLYKKINTFISTKALVTDIYMSQAGSPNVSDDDGDSNTATVTKEKPKLKRPSLYKVILLNDDYTPMEFVVLVLTRYFSKSPQEAERVMLEVHQQGAGLAGIYPFEVAETKVFTVNEFSRRQKHPLKCIMEEVSSEEV